LELSKRARHTFVEQQWYELLEFVETDAADRRVETQRQMFVVRRPMYYIINAYLMIFLITLTALCFFSISFRLPRNRLQSTGNTLIASISFKWVTNRVAPIVSYTTSLDRYSLVYPSS
jgi:hypothetical protein